MQFHSVYFVTITFALLTTCVHNLPPDNLSLATIRLKQKEHQDFQKQLQLIEETRTSYPDLKPHTQDIYLILKAMEAENLNQTDDAMQYWKEGLKVTSDVFSEDIFRGWLNLYLKSVRKPKDLVLLAKVVLKETNDGADSYFLKKQELTDEARLSKWLATIFPVDEEEKAVINAKEPEAAYTMPPPNPGFPLDDPRLENTARIYCEAKHPGEYQWKAWGESLGEPGTAYWQALTHMCRDEPAAAIAVLKQALRQQHVVAREQYLLVLSYQKLVLLLRRNDARDEAAAYYKALMDAWGFSGVTPEAMGMELDEFLFARINDALWAARYRALIGDYAHAKIYVQEAMDQISVAKTRIPVLTTQISEQLGEYKAEGLHILAFRVATEQQEYSHAASLAKAGLQIPHLNQEWQDRLLWYQGFYEFLDGNFNQAWQKWQALRKQTQQDSLINRTLFWLAYLAHKKGRQEKSLRLLHELGQRDPLNYYYVVAPGLANMPSEDHWKGRFQDPKNLEKILVKDRNYETDQIRDHEKIGPVLAKTELLLLAGLRQWALPVSEQLHKLATKTFSLARNPDAFLYLSRILYSAGNYDKSISLSWELAKNQQEFWRLKPEQLHIFFPRAYASKFHRYAGRSGLDVSLLYAISRQESRFKADARSYARALGLMQLITPTALRVAAAGNFNLNDRNAEDRLLEADTNIAIGTMYLKMLDGHYRKNLPAVIASYNAGEYAVDMWLRRRHHPDSLIWVEMIPFGETRKYVQKVWRNLEIYEYLGAGRAEIVFRPELLRRKQAHLKKREADSVAR